MVANQRRCRAPRTGDRVLLLEPTAVLVGGALRAAALPEAVALQSRRPTEQSASRRRARRSGRHARIVAHMEEWLSRG
jgi:hypothetical protein